MVSLIASQLLADSAMMFGEMARAFQSRFCCCLSNIFDGCSR